MEERWIASDSGRAYVDRRWRSRGARNRDPRLLSGLLQRHLSNPQVQQVLDVPCGTGRLQETLERFGPVTAMDVSRSMLTQRSSQRPGLQGDAWCMPFQDGRFELVVSCRLLHHVADPGRRADLVRELCRVSRGWVLASFWDARCWHAWRRRQGRRRANHPDARVAVARGQLEADFEAAGARVIDYRSSLRWITPQTWLLARIRG